MSGRYLMRCFDVGVEVYDSTTGPYDTATAVFGPASYETASRVAADMNLREPRPTAAPSCNCAAKLKDAEDKAERCRHALAQIYRYSDCRIALRYAEDALSVKETTMPFDALRNADDPGINYPSLDAVRLASGGSIDVQIRRRSHWSERAMRRVHIAFWLTFWLLLGFSVTAAIWVRS